MPVVLQPCHNKQPLMRFFPVFPRPGSVVSEQALSPPVAAMSRPAAAGSPSAPRPPVRHRAPSTAWGVGWVCPRGPSGAGWWWVSPPSPRGTKGEWRRLSLRSPKVLAAPHLLACIAKPGAPRVSQARGIPDLLLCPLLQVCWALCPWSARMEARGPYLSSAATQVGVRCHLPPP